MGNRGHLVVVAAIFAWGCARETTSPPPVVEGVFTKPGILEIQNADGVKSVTIRDDSGRPIAVAETFGRERLEVRLNWVEGKSYELVPDVGTPLKLNAPEEKPEVALRIHAPLGQHVHEFFLVNGKSQKEDATITLLADPGETIDLLLEVEKLSSAGDTELAVSVAPEQVPPEGTSLNPVIKDESVSLSFEFDKRIWLSRITLGDKLPGNPILVTASGPKISFSARLMVSKRDMKAGDVTVVGWKMPCDQEGLFQAQRRPDQVSLPNPVWSKIASLLNIRTEQVSYFEPFVFERVDFRNNRRQPISLLLKSAVVDSKTKTPVPFFLAPSLAQSGTTKQTMGYCQIPALSMRSCVLPIYVKPETPDGTFERRVEIYPMGSDKRIDTLKGEVNVQRSNTTFSAWLVVIVLVSFGWLFLLIFYYKRMVAAFGVRLLVLLSLLGSLLCGFQVGGNLIAALFYALLGPFNCLVSGLFTEVLTYLIITSVLHLVPRVGAMTIAGLVSYLLRGILLGQFGLVDILFTGSRIAFFELFLFVFGVTRVRPKEHYRPRIGLLMIALGLADAANTFTSLTLHSIFYRLFYADWYIFLQVAITGFCYTVLGVYLGRSLGSSLRKVHL